MSSGILTIRGAVKRFTDHDTRQRPSNAVIDKAITEAAKRGIRFDSNGRGVAPWLPNKAGYRYEKGKLIRRFAHRAA
jgi:hypothetical protein